MQKLIIRVKINKKNGQQRCCFNNMKILSRSIYLIKVKFKTFWKVRLEFMKKLFKSSVTTTFSCSLWLFLLSLKTFILRNCFQKLTADDTIVSCEF